MSVGQMRVALSKLYGPSWAGTVEKMKDAQVYSVYMKHLNQGSFKK